MRLAPSSNAVRTAMLMNMGNRSFQSPNLPRAHAAITGARNDAMALTNCPIVRLLARRLRFTMSDISGLIDTCIRVLPMPSSAKESIMTPKL